MDTKLFSLEYLPPIIKTKDGWKHLEYRVLVKYNDSLLYDGPYCMGLGCIDMEHIILDPYLLLSFSPEEEQLLFAWQSKKYANFKDKDLHVKVAAKIAHLNNIEPTLNDVLNSVLMDGEAFFSAQNFEEWARDLGYNNDSIKDRDMYCECDKIGRQFAKVFTQLEIQELIMIYK